MKNILKIIIIVTIFFETSCKSAISVNGEYGTKDGSAFYSFDKQNKRFNYLSLGEGRLLGYSEGHYSIKNKTIILNGYDSSDIQQIHFKYFVSFDSSINPKNEVSIHYDLRNTKSINIIKTYLIVDSYQLIAIHADTSLFFNERPKKLQFKSFIPYSELDASSNFSGKEMSLSGLDELLYAHSIDTLYTPIVDLLDETTLFNKVNISAAVKMEDFFREIIINDSLHIHKRNQLLKKIRDKRDVIYYKK